jgi:uncharacterized protein (DUF58 family)
MREIPYLLGAMFLIALLLRLDFAFYIVYVVGGIWLLARWATPRSMKALAVQRRFVSHAFLGETIPVTLELRNSTRLLIPWLRASEVLPPDLAAADQIRRVYTLRPRERVVIDYRLHCSQRGYYAIGPLLLTSGDLFGFAGVQTRSEAVQHLTVYPRIIPLAGLALPSRLPFGVLASPQRMFEDPARLRGVREYQAGDSLRRINWKASAHSDALLVNQYSPAISLESMILLNLNASEYERQRRHDASEWAIVIAASLAAYLESRRQAVGLAVHGIDGLPGAADASPTGVVSRSAAMPPRPGRQHLMKVLELLARVEIVDSGEPFVQWAQRTAAPLAWGATVLAITPSGDESTCQGLHRLTRAGLNVVMFVVEPYNRFDLVQQRARRLGIQAHMVASEQDLERLQVLSGALVPSYRGAVR